MGAFLPHCVLHNEPKDGPKSIPLPLQRFFGQMFVRKFFRSMRTAFGLWPFFFLAQLLATNLINDSRKLILIKTFYFTDRFNCLKANNILFLSVSLEKNRNIHKYILRAIQFINCPPIHKKGCHFTSLFFR